MICIMIPGRHVTNAEDSHMDNEYSPALKNRQFMIPYAILPTSIDMTSTAYVLMISFLIFRYLFNRLAQSPYAPSSTTICPSMAVVGIWKMICDTSGHNTPTVNAYTGDTK